MRLSQVTITRFRCIEQVTLDLDDYTVVVGRNGSGKSTLLEAIEFFFSVKYSPTVQDFFNHDATRELSVAITIVDLAEDESHELSKYIRDGRLVIEKVCRRSERDDTFETSYHGTRFQCPDFDHVRALAGRLFLRAYKALQDSSHPDLQRAASEAQGRAQLEAWEEQHQDQCAIERDDGRFFGYSAVGIGKLKKCVTFVRVPARMTERDYDEGREGNTLRALVDTLVRQRGGASTALDDLKARVERDYDALLQDDAFDLSAVSSALSMGVAEFVPDASVDVRWAACGIRLQEPSAVVQLTEGGLTTPPRYKGHGLLRAYELSVLALLSESVIDQMGEDASRVLLIAVEEPELYQHPTQVRRIAERLKRLGGSSVAGSRVQVVCTSHSPLFVSIEDCEQLRLVRRTVQGRLQGAATIRRPTFEGMAQRMREAGFGGEEITGERLASRMHHLFQPNISEAVFADFVIIVEGQEDQAFVRAVFASQNLESKLSDRGIFIAAVGGKNNIDKLVVLLHELGIPHYVLFDTDSHKQDPDREDELNGRIVSLCTGGADAAVPRETSCRASWATFDPTLSDWVSREVGADRWRTTESEVAGALGWASPAAGRKNPTFVRACLSRLAGNGGVPAGAIELMAAIGAAAGLGGNRVQEEEG